MTMKKIFYIIISLIPVLWIGCKEDPIGQTPTNKTAPPPLSENSIEITPLQGGAYVSYILPDIEDLAYVKGEFVHKGVKRIVRSSVYKNYMEIEGLGNTEPVELSLMVVNNSEVSSTPVVRVFTPLEPAITAIKESLIVEPDFSGMNIYWKNPTRILTKVNAFLKNERNELEFKDIAISSLENGEMRFRGLKIEPHTFAIIISDRFNNNSDTAWHTIMPIYEQMLDKTLFQEGKLSGDNVSTTSNDPRYLRQLWDNRYNERGLWITDDAAGSISYVMPQTFTIDLGVMTQVSRFVLFFRYGVENGESRFVFNQYTPKVFNVYGTDELKEPVNSDYYSVNGNWKDDWVRMHEETYEVIKPSGLPLGQFTREDLDAVKAGIEFKCIFDLAKVPKVRYLRFEVESVFNGSNSMEMYEIEIFGDSR